MEKETRNLIAGFTAGALTTLLLHPLDLIKTRLQISHSSISTAEMFRRVYRQEHLRGLYSGLSANFAGASCSWGLYFYLYSKFKNNPPDNLSTYTFHLLAATKAGFLTALCTNPLWLIKTRMCTQSTDIKYKSLFHAFQTIIREEGVRGLYRGLTPALFGVSHGAIQFMVYEDLKTKYPSSQDEFKGTDYILMAVTSKVIATISTYPYQTIKSRLQTHTQSFSGVFDVIKYTARNECIRGFYRGLGANIIRVLPGTITTFLIYEFTMHSLSNIYEYNNDGSS